MHACKLFYLHNGGSVAKFTNTIQPDAVFVCINSLPERPARMFKRPACVLERPARMFKRPANLLERPACMLERPKRMFKRPARTFVCLNSLLAWYENLHNYMYYRCLLYRKD